MTYWAFSCNGGVYPDISGISDKSCETNGNNKCQCIAWPGRLCVWAVDASDCIDRRCRELLGRKVLPPAWCCIGTLPGCASKGAVIEVPIILIEHLCMPCCVSIFQYRFHKWNIRVYTFCAFSRAEGFCLCFAQSCLLTQEPRKEWTKLKLQA